ncbi:Signal transduction protein [Dimargaris xerosporica]|nr:Signal transduction protein [Dimargaris xerosporica]
MRFAEYLEAEAVPEWQKKYLNYRTLKRALRAIAQANTSLVSLRLPSVMHKAQKQYIGGTPATTEPVQSTTSSTDDLPELVPAGHNLAGANGSGQRRLSVRHSFNPLSRQSMDRRMPHYDQTLIDNYRASVNLRRNSVAAQRRPSWAQPDVGMIKEGASSDPAIHRTAAAVQSTATHLAPMPQAPVINPSQEDAFYLSIDVDGGKGDAVKHGARDPAAITTQLSHRSPEERTFFNLYDNELDKVSEFYAELEAKLVARYRDLVSQCEHFASIKKQLRRRSSIREAARPIKSVYQKFVPNLKELSSQPPRRPSSQGPAARRPSHVAPPSRRQSKRFSWYNPSDCLDGAQQAEYNYRTTRSMLKKAIMELYRGTELAKNYRVLNYTGFIKLLNKYERRAHWPEGAEHYYHTVESRQFVQSTALDNMLKQIEDLYVSAIADGSRKAGIKKLRVPDTRFNTFHTSAIRCGILFGMTVPMFIYIIYMLQVPELWLLIPYLSSLLKVYGGILLCNLLAVLMGINMYVWGRNRINYKFIYEFNPRSNLNYMQYLELPLMLLLLTMGFICISITNPFYRTIPSYVYPGVLVGLSLLIVLCPLPIMRFQARKFFFNNVKRVLVTPLYDVKFKDFFLADQMISLSYSIGSIYMMGCAYANHWTDLHVKCKIAYTWAYPGLLMIPSLWRTIQCTRRAFTTGEYGRYLPNTLKYFLSCLSYWVATMYRIDPDKSHKIAWIVVATVYCLYSYAWDIYYDWGMVEHDKGKNIRLRRERRYAWTWTYWFAIVANFILRCTWTAALANVYFHFKDKNHFELITFLAALGEMLRRFMWNFFRMENEQVNNCGQFRATKDLPLPFDLHDQSGDSFHSYSSFSQDNSDGMPGYYTDSKKVVADANHDDDENGSWEDTVRSVGAESDQSAEKLVDQRVRPRSVVIQVPEDHASGRK